MRAGSYLLGYCGARTQCMGSSIHASARDSRNFEGINVMGSSQISSSIQRLCAFKSAADHACSDNMLNAVCGDSTSAMSSKNTHTEHPTQNPVNNPAQVKHITNVKTNSLQKDADTLWNYHSDGLGLSSRTYMSEALRLLCVLRNHLKRFGLRPSPCTCCR